MWTATVAQNLDYYKKVKLVERKADQSYNINLRQNDDNFVVFAQIVGESSKRTQLIKRYYTRRVG